MDNTKYLYKFNINNGNAPLGLAVRYFSYNHLLDKSNSAIIGRLWKSENKDRENYELFLPYGVFDIEYQGNKYQIHSNKVGEPNSEFQPYLYACEVVVYLKETNEYNSYLNLEELSIIRQERHEFFKEIVANFIKDSKKHYDTYITEVENKPGTVGVYIYDEYWELLNRHEPRLINTIHLDGKEQEILDYINKFKTEDVKKRYADLGIPYKKNIMFEGYPGTGKSSLIFCLASELDCNIAIINFNRDMDDNNFMRAIRRLPDDCILVLEDLDALFKARKENDENKNNITFSALLNTLDGLAFRKGMITIMTTNYLCNLDSALKRPGRIDKTLNFGLATKSQVQNMFSKFYPEKKEEFSKFYSLIKYCKFTTAIIQQYFMWYMEDYEEIYDNLELFKEICEKNNYESSNNLYT